MAFLKSLFKAVAKVLSAPKAADSSMAVDIGGSAAATGDNTLATGTVKSKMVDHGPVTVEKGSAEFLAAGQGSASGPTASAGTYANVTGADLVITLSGGGGSASSDTVTASSSLKLLAIDIAGWSPRNGPIAINVDTHKPAGTVAVAPGNVATVDASAGAYGANSYAGTSTGSLAVDGHLSAVTGSAQTLIA